MKKVDGVGRVRLVVVLEEVQVAVDDRMWLAPGELRFHCAVASARDVRRAQMTRVPPHGVIRAHGGRQAIGAVVFDAVVAQGGEMVFSLSADGSHARGAYTFPVPSETPSTSVVAFEADGTKRAWSARLRLDTSAAHDALDEIAPRDTLREQFVADRRDDQGRFDPQMWARARAERAALRQPNPAEDDPGPADHPLCRAAGKEVRVRETKNPGRPAVFGDVGRTVAVDGHGRLGDDASLVIPLATRDLDGLDPASVRVFAWDARRERFRPVRRSGLGRDGRYAWARIGRAGTYAVIGRPTDVARQTTIDVLCALDKWIPLWFEVGGQGKAFNQKICQLILCAPEFREALDSVETLARFGLEPRVGRDLTVYGDSPLDPKGRPIGPAPVVERAPRISVGNVCDQCIGSGIPVGPWPDCDIPDQFPGQCGCEEWKPIGPNNYGGRVRAVGFNPADRRIVYAGNAQGGVYKSTSGGNHWSPTMSGELSLAIGALAVAPSNGAIIYAGTGEYGGWYLPGVGVYRSSNHGNDWDLTRGTPASDRISRIVVHPNDPDLVYVAGNSGVARTTDGGITWTTILAGSVSDIALDPVNPLVLYAARENAAGVQLTNNAEASPGPVAWAALNGGLELTANHPAFPVDNFIKLSAVPDGAGGSAVWLQANFLPNPWAPPAGDPNPARPPRREEYRTRAYELVAGANWQVRGEFADTSYFRWCSVIAVEPGRPNVVYRGNVGMSWTDDGGQTWYALNAGHADVHAIAFDPGDLARTIVGNDGGLFAHTRALNADGTAAETVWSYTAINSGHDSIEFLNVAVSEDGAFAIAGSTQDQGVLVGKGGGSFQGLGGSEWGPVDIHARSGAIIMWDPQYERSLPPQRTEDTGATRRDANTGLGGRYLTEIVMHPQDSLIVLAAAPQQSVANVLVNGGIYRSADGGAAAGGFGLVRDTANLVATSIRFAPSDPTRVYAVLSDGSLVFSTDTGQTWNPLGNGPVVATPVKSITVDWTDPDLLFITYTRAGVRHVWSADVQIGPPAALVWRDISGTRPYSSIPDVPCHCLVVDGRSSETFYVATDIGVFRTTDGGDWWYPFDEGLPNALLTDIGYSPARRTLYVSTFGRGMYARTI